jgi:subtilisin family serine protease
MLKEWVVTLHRKEDLEGFYDDMETPGGNLFIPDRSVGVANRRLISRNTHYMLSEEEAELIKSDNRVWGVDLLSFIEETITPYYKITNGDFDKSGFDDASDLNWGLLRHSETTNRQGWGLGGTTLETSDLTITASGKNVDVVIVDGHINPAHPEFAVNQNGSGGSRVEQFNWFSLTNDVTGGANGTYTYTPYVDLNDFDATNNNNHGAHCAGTVAGNSQGWARGASIYNINPYSTNPNTLSSTLMWDYIRVWHNTKPVNTETGRRNPTITNNSYGSTLKIGPGNYPNITAINYRGTLFEPGRDLTQTELQERGCYANNEDGALEIPSYFVNRIADMQDAIDEGVIIVAAAGNDSWRTVNSDDPDYNNYYKIGSSNTQYYLHRGTGSGAGYAPVINVGALGTSVFEEKAAFSNCGSQVDIFAAGQSIQSSVHSKSGDIADPRLSGFNLDKYNGTSMASPQVAGVIALLAESDQNITQAEAQEWLIANALTDQIGIQNDDPADPMDVYDLQGAPNRILFWKNQRPEAGPAFPKVNLKTRPTSGMTYPRLKVRR